MVVYSFMMEKTTLEFCELLPKIELHAHLNGSLSEKTLKRLGCLDEQILEYKNLLKIIQETKSLDKCFGIFKIPQAATNNRKLVYLATQAVIEEFFNDNVMYLELRSTPRAEDDMTKEEYVESIVKAVKDNEKDIIVKLILSIDRRHDAANSWDSLDVILKMKEQYPDLIKGVDLSGNPYVSTFNEKLFMKARENGLHSVIHCAEIKNDKEVEQILNFGPDRLGHVTFLHPKYEGSQENWDLYCKKKIPAEFCLTSNVICGTSKSYQDHHIQEWIKAGLPFSINTDDKGIFCTSLSKEYEHTITNFNLSRDNLWAIIYDAIDHSFASVGEKMLLRKKLEDWKRTNIHCF